MPLVPVTSVLCIAAALGLVGLSIPISLRRFGARISLGDGNDRILQARVRAQANFVEYVPLALIAIGLAEAQGAPSWLVAASAVSLAGGRVVHAFGMLTGARPRPRAIGMTLTWLSLLLAAGGLAFLRL